MRYLGIDFGMRRIGLALSDESGAMAFPHSVVRNSAHAAAEIAVLAAREGVGAIVVGRSLALSGEPNPLEREIERFAAELAVLARLPVHFEDERYTSAAAERVQGKNDLHDASAAALLLTQFLQKIHNAS